MLKFLLKSGQMLASWHPFYNSTNKSKSHILPR